MNIGISLVGRIGDIISSIPIGQYYVDKGYTVHWPVIHQLVKPLQFACPQIKWYPIKYDGPPDTAHWYYDSHKILDQFNCDKIFDLSFRMKGYDKATQAWEKSGLKFDVFRYKESYVPLKHKWDLKIVRDYKREQQLYDKLVGNANGYFVKHFQGSNTHRGIQLDNRDGLKDVEIQPYTDNIFDWIMILEKANYLVLLDSCFANLVEQLNLPNQKYFLLRSPHTRTPILKNQWTMI